MMSALECYQKAARCEAMARSSIDRSNACMLRDTAMHWRNLGEAAKVREAATFAQRGAKGEP